jgi:hypothetical protein
MNDVATLAVLVKPTHGDYGDLQKELVRDQDATSPRRVLTSLFFALNAGLVAAGTEIFVVLLHMPAWLATLLCFYPANLVYSAVRRACEPLTHRVTLDPKGIFLTGFEARIEPEALQLTGQWGDARYLWPSIMRVRETFDHIFVYVDRASAVFIPKRGFSSRNEAEKFADALRTHAKLAVTRGKAFPR